MSRSQPKHKIIYRQLEQMFRSGSSSKFKQKPELSIKLSRNIESHSCKASRSSSKHSLTIKQKIVKEKQTASKKSHRDIQQEHYKNQIEKIYAEMQNLIHHSKQSLVQKLKQNPYSYSQSIKELTKMSRCIKQMFSYFLERDGIQQNSRVSTKVFTEASTNQQHDVSKLSLQNQKKRKSNRKPLQKDSNRKPSVYEMVLMKKMR